MSSVRCSVISDSILFWPQECHTVSLGDVYPEATPTGWDVASHSSPLRLL